MMDFMRDGGWGMYPVLIFGILTLLAAGAFAIHADPKARGFIDAMARSIGYFTLTGVIANFNAIGRYLENVPRERYAEVLFTGIREAIGPAIMGCAFLAVIYLFVAVGQRRIAARG